MTRSATVIGGTGRRIFLLHAFSAFLSALLVIGLVYGGVMQLLEDQTSDVVEAELRGLVDEFATGGSAALRSAIARRSASDGQSDGVYLFVTRSGQPIAGNLSRFPQVPADGSWQLLELLRTDLDRSVWVGGRAFTLNTGSRVFVGRDLREQREFRGLLLRLSIGLLILFLLTGSVGGYGVSRSILRRVREIEVVAAGVRDGDLSKRAVDRGTGDEFDSLSRSLNAMLSSNETLIAELRAVTDSLSHDLRTPLARAQALIEQIPADPADPDAASRRDQAIGEIAHVQSVFSSLIDLSRLESGVLNDQLEQLDLVELVNGLADLYRPMIEEQGLEFSVLAEGAVPRIGHAQFLARALANLLDNAIKFSPAGGTIEIAVDHSADAIDLTVSDHGPGIAPEDWTAALGRFGRLDAARSVPGSGLGLSLVETIARLHGASLMSDRVDGVFTIRLRFPEPRDHAFGA
ncbi:MAG: HAMP domain-containing sensor histidine kinase [Pseudomonadota bacterium]